MRTDLQHALAIPGEPKSCSGERADARLCLRRQHRDHSLVSIVRLFSHATPISVLRLSRETSNKALNAVNQLDLVPFLASFLAARDKLPLSTVTSAGMFHF